MRGIYFDHATMVLSSYWEVLISSQNLHLWAPHCSWGSCYGSDKSISVESESESRVDSLHIEYISKKKQRPEVLRVSKMLKVIDQHSICNEWRQHLIADMWGFFIDNLINSVYLNFVFLLKKLNDNIIWVKVMNILIPHISHRLEILSCKILIGWFLWM